MKNIHDESHHMPSLTESAGKAISMKNPPCKLRHVADAKTFYDIPLIPANCGHPGRTEILKVSLRVNEEGRFK